jgi:hypothetical protein
MAHALQAAPENLCTLYQVHSPRAVIVHEAFAGTPPEADALVTNVKGLALGILTADCAPILLADAQAGVVGAAHAGWKGALTGAAEACVRAMEQLARQVDELGHGGLLGGIQCDCSRRSRGRPFGRAEPSRARSAWTTRSSNSSNFGSSIAISGLMGPSPGDKADGDDPVTRGVKVR